MDSGNTGNNSDEKHIKMAIRTESNSEDVVTESSEDDLKICTSDSDNDCSNAESSAEESLSSGKIAGEIPRCNDFDFTSAEKKSHTLSLQNFEIFGQLKNVETLADLAKPYNVTVKKTCDIQTNKRSILPFDRNQASKCDNSSYSSSDFNVRSNESSKTSRKQHIKLTEKEKMDIAQRLKNGESAVSLSRVYKVTLRTIYYTKKKLDSRLMSASTAKNEDCLEKQIAVKKANNTSLKDAVYMWYLEELYQDKEVTLPLLCEKALKLNNELGERSSFKASYFWLRNFRSHYGIKCEEKKQIFTEDTRTQSSYLQKYYIDALHRERIFPGNMYTVDETEIEWQSVPQTSRIFNRSDEKCLERAERITIMLCVNVTWTHALPLLVIGKTEKGKEFKTNLCPSVMYRWQKNGSIDSKIFMDWYTNAFIPAVKTKHRGQVDKGEKVLLFLKNSPFYPAVCMLNAVDENFETEFLSSNVTPMGQILKRKLKRIFKKSILRRLLSTPENEVMEYLQNLSLEESCNMLHDAWITLCEEKKKERNKHLGVSAEHDTAVFKPENDMEEFLKLFQSIPAFSQFSKENALEWVLIDTIDSCHQRN